MQLQARVRIWGRPRGRSGIFESDVLTMPLARENARVGAGSEIPEINYTPQPIVPERTTYIGVVVKDQDGEFVPHTRVRIKLPDGDEFVRKTDQDGEVMIKGFVIDGMAEIELLDFVEALPDTAAADEEETTAEEVAAAEELLTEEKEFVVKVVDETGKGVSDVSLVFSGAGKSKSVPTDGGGVAKWKAAAESVEVTFESAESVNKAMKAVWKSRAATAEGDYVQPSSDVVAVVSRAKAIETPEGGMFSSTSVDATQPMTLSVRPAKKRALLIEMHDTLFRNNSAVVNPEGEAPSSTVGEHESITTVGLIATILRYNEEHEGKKLFIAGHTDRAGDEKDNVKLSNDRAKAVCALIEGNKAEFVKACKAHYSEVDVTQLMDWTNTQYGFACKPTTLKENPSDENYYLFRKSYLEWIKGAVDEENGEIGPRGAPIGQYGRVQDDIWAAMFDLYEHNLRQELGEESDGVAQLRSKLVWVDDGTKTIGFGEKHPTAENTVDGTRSQADRRVEVMLFDEEDAPDLAGKKGEDVYDGVTFERKTIEPMTTAKREPIVIALRDTGDRPVIGAGVELSFADAVFSRGTSDSNGECRLKAQQVPELLLRITSIDETNIASGTQNTVQAHFADEFAQGQLVPMSPQVTIWLTKCDLTIVLDDTQVTPPQRIAVLESSDGSVVRRRPMPTAENDDVVQSLTFDQLPTFRKSYKLSIELPSGSVEVFSRKSIAQILASIQAAREGLVDAEPNPDNRQAALESDCVGVVV